MAFAACTESSALRACVSGHVAGCEACGLEVAGLQIVAGLLLAMHDPMPLRSGARDRALAAIRVSS